MNIKSWCGDSGNPIYHTQFDTASRFTDLIPGDIAFFINNGKVEFDRLESSPIGYQHLLRKCSPLASILGKKADMFANGNLIFTNARTDNVLRGSDKQWETLLKKPNAQQTQMEFLHQLYVYSLLRGFCYIYPVKSIGFSTPQSLVILPPWLITVEAIRPDFGDFSANLIDRKVILTWRGERTEFDESELILCKDPGAILINEYTFLPESRLVELSRPIATLIAAQESRHTIVTRRGPSGIFANKTDKGDQTFVPVTDDEKKELQSSFRQYGTLRDQYQAIITNAAVTWQKVGSNMKELMLFEEHERDVMDICDRYGYPYELLSSSKGVTYENKDAAKKEAYQDGVLPDSRIICEQLQTGLGIVDTVKLEMDYSHVEILQESLTEKGQGTLTMSEAHIILWDNNIITLNDWREAVGMELLPDVQFSMYKYDFDKWMTDNGYVETDLTVNPRGVDVQNPQDAAKDNGSKK